MPPIVITIIGAIEMLIRIAPGAAEVVKRARQMIAAQFGAQVITASEQQALFDRVDAIAKEAADGILPDWWEVEPDPEDKPES